MADRMGFEGIAYIGAAGSTATNQLDKSRDITYNMDPEKGDTTSRGDSSGPPIKTENVTQRVVSIEIVMINESTDTNLETMRAAAYAGTPIAVRTKDYSAGKGYDGDCTISCGHPYPLAGEQVLTFTCTPTKQSGRVPSLYV